MPQFRRSRRQARVGYVETGRGGAGGEAVSDRELLELAAKAAGYGEVWYLEGYDTPYIGPRYTGGTPQYTTFKPLTDDGDALRLAVKLRLTVLEASVLTPDGVAVNVFPGEAPDRYAATRRASVRAAAESGRAMK